MVVSFMTASNGTNKKARARRQHIVPRWLLVNFEDGAGTLWAYAKGRPVRPSGAVNECSQRDFYEYELNGKSTANRYEDWLGVIESDANSVFKAVITRQQLTQHDAEIWSTFVAALFMRTRKVRKQISDGMVQRFKKQTDDPAFIRNMQYELLQQGELVAAEDLKKEIDKLREAMDSSPSFYHVSGLPRHTRSLAQAVLTKQWHTLEAPDGKAFVISDCPVVTVAINGRQIAPGAGFANPNVAILLPITPKAIFVASPPDIGWKTIITAVGVDSVNRLLVQFGHQNVYSNTNSSEMQLLVDLELDALKYGVNTFLPAAS